MTWTKLATIALAILCIIAAALLPDVKIYLIPIATYLGGWVMPELGRRVAGEPEKP